MYKIYLAVGSNVEDKKKNIELAIEQLREQITHIKTARFYVTKPVGYTQQDNFLNTALSGTTKLTPNELLKFVKRVEKKVGRVERFHWGPREVDIDVILYGDLVFKDKQLTIPHSRMHERDFVLIPLAELNPNLIHPVLNKSIKQLLAEIPEEERSLIDTSLQTTK